MTSLIALLAGYFGLLAALHFAVRPKRMRLLELAEHISAEYPEDELANGFSEGLLKTAYSWRAAPIRLLATMLALLTPGKTLDQNCEEMVSEHPKFFHDPRLPEMIDAYHVSIAAVNPIFGVLFFIAKAAFYLKAVLHHGRLRQETLMVDFVGNRQLA